MNRLYPLTALLAIASLRLIDLASAESRFEILEPSKTGLYLENRYDDPLMWKERFREFTLGAVSVGIASGDVNGDGRPDIYAVSKTGPNGLFIQTETPLVFENRAKESGVEGTAHWETGATFVDIDNDGDLDIYVCVYDAPNQLFLNRGDATFVESAARFGLDLSDASVMAAFADYDRDGDLDVYLQTNILDFSKNTKGSPDYLYRNNGDGSFTDVTNEAGIWGRSQGHSATWWDFDNDDWPDLYVANDFETPDRFYRNNGDGTFSDAVEELVPLTTFFSMGADLGDLNNDGWMDLMVADMEAADHFKDMSGMEERSRGIWETETAHELTPQYARNAIYLNSGAGRFREAAYLYGVAGTNWTWSVKLHDLDNDGWLDLFVTNGMVRNLIDADLQDRQNTSRDLAHRAAIVKQSPPLTERNFAFRNTGNLGFEDVSHEWNLDHLDVAFGCTVCDFDRDGDLDIAYVAMDQPVMLCRNDLSEKPRFLSLRLQGTQSNKWGIGSQVRITSKETMQMRQLTLARGIVSSDEPLVHFGLGNASSVERIEIRWPSGTNQILKNVPANQFLTVKEPKRRKSLKPNSNEASASPLFTERQDLEMSWPIHEQLDTAEFDRNSLLPRRLGQEGPGLASGDLNGDGIDDIYVGGGIGQSGVIMLSQSDGKPHQAIPLDQDIECDDVAAAIFDADGDAMLDLLVISGGAPRPGHERFGDRLYLNRGASGFAKAASDIWPTDRTQSGAIAAADFDGDGDVDVFIGGRSLPERYPFSPPSRLLRNDKGRFTEVTHQLAPALERPGLVTAAKWFDLDNEGPLELALALEWGPISVFKKRNGKFVDVSDELGLSSHVGLWQSLETADLNGDGRIDFIAGNLGLNTKYHASPSAPMTLFAGDIDGNGKHAIVEAYYEEGRLLPARGRSKLQYAFPWVSSKFRDFQSFAKADLASIFGPEKLSQATRFEASQLRSGIFLSQANGTYVFEPLGRMAQLAPTLGIASGDWNKDGHLDLALAQNFFGQEASTGRLTGSIGLILIGSDDGAFAALPSHESGFLLPGNQRALLSSDLDNDHQPELIATENGGPVRIFSLAKR